MPLLRRRDLLQRSASALLTAALASTGLPSLAQTGGHPGIELTQLMTERGDDGLLLSYTVRLELSKDVEDALYKGVAVVFVAEAELFKSRWYWYDKPKVRIVRRWRLAYQPLTRHWRLSFDGLSRSYNALNEALGVMRRATQWRISDNVSGEDDHYVIFGFRLDTDELPRPMQIGLGGQNDWNLAVQRRITVTQGR
ncbi:DUF4390 domain-containing protein [Aquabacterium sp.]|uniref:DUF4390 domain-containing protein n=1 Tax=Aquabacterium sp. TaxID=1872578 RepID=UPI0019CAAA2D|nr:DUF4390 domain-containing protein [Aquabacterium sp.]MBC7701065.1 DUF4390 domain-containing protein [Aquabacterium sp.]